MKLENATNLQIKDFYTSYPFIKLMIEYFEHQKIIFIVTFHSFIVVFSKKKMKLIRIHHMIKQTDCFLNFLVASLGVVLSKFDDDFKSLFEPIVSSVWLVVRILNQTFSSFGNTWSGNDFIKTAKLIITEL